jgi:hypothetical protein
MRFFNTLPLTVNADNNGNFYAIRNLMVRTDLIPQLLKNPLLFYQYEIRDGDTPEIIANKYYGDSYRYWIGLMGNPQIMDVQADWPMTSQQFNDYLNDAYGELAAQANTTVLQYCNSTIHHYQQVITTIDNNTQTTAIKTIEIDEDTYNNITEVFPGEIRYFADGSSFSYILQKQAVSILTYEYDTNEAKRNINLINSTHTTEMENQYQALLKL